MYKDREAINEVKARWHCYETATHDKTQHEENTQGDKSRCDTV